MLPFPNSESRLGRLLRRLHSSWWSISLCFSILLFASAFQADRSVARPKSSSWGRSDIRTNAPPRLVVAISEAGDDGGKEEMSSVDEYRNGITAFLSNFMQSDETQDDPLADIDFGAPKAPKMRLADLAAVLDAELYDKEWFVTGRVNPIYFDDAFRFQDPDVKVDGIEDYARGVRKLFDDTSRAQIISSAVNATTPNTITVTWRLSGGVKIFSGLRIKPYICYTDFTVDEESGLILFQEDRFDIPGWDILLSALFPFLIGKVTQEPAPEVEPRVVPMPTIATKEEGGMLDGLFRQLGLK